MRYLFIILTLLLDLFFLQSVAVAQTSSQTAAQTSKQNKQQLTLDQIKKKIRVYADSKNEKDKASLDKAIAVEINQGDVKDFQPCDSILNDLRNLGAGPQTIQALKTLKSNAANSTEEQDKSSQKIVILVADFSSEDKKDYSVTQLIIDQLAISTGKYQDVEVKPLGRTIPKGLSRKEVIAEGKKHNATILIWGWLGNSGEAVIIHAHFEVISKIHNVVISDSNMLGGTLEIIAELSELLKGFTIQSRLRSELTVITLFATALSRLEAHDYKVAISQFSEALRQEAVPEKIVNISDILTARGLAYLADEGVRSKNAATDFKEAIRANDKNFMAHVELMFIYLYEDKFDDSLIHGKKVLELESDIEIQAVICSLLWTVSYDKNKPEQAEYFWDKLRQIPEGNSNIAISLARGLVHYHKRDFNSALSYYDRALQLSDNLEFKAGFRSLKGISHRALEEYDKAIKEFDEALCLDPKQVLLYYYLGRVYSTKTEYKQAIKNYSKYLESDNQEKREEAFIYRGEAYLIEGDKDKALEDFNRAISLNPHFISALYGRATVYFAKNQLDDSISDFNEIIKLNPKEVNAFLFRGRVYILKNLPDEALKDYNEVIKLDQNNGLAYLSRGKLLAMKGERERAVSDFQRVLQITHDPQLRVLQIINYSQLQQDAQQQLNLLGVK